MRPDPHWRRLRRAARRGDAAETRALAHVVLSAEDREAPQALTRLDQALYGRDAEAPALVDVVRAVRSEAR